MTLTDEQKANLTSLAHFCMTEVADLVTNNENLDLKVWLEGCAFITAHIKDDAINTATDVQVSHIMTELTTKLGIEMGKKQDMRGLI